MGRGLPIEASSSIFTVASLYSTSFGCCSGSPKRVGVRRISFSLDFLLECLPKQHSLSKKKCNYSHSTIITHFKMHAMMIRMHSAATTTPAAMAPMTLGVRIVLEEVLA